MFAPETEVTVRPLRVVTIGCIAWLVLMVVLASPASAFPDVPDNHRYARAINELADLGIVSGRLDGTFGPNDPVLRAQFAKMICGLLGIEVNEDLSFAPFTDLGPDDPESVYPHEFVGAAYQAHLTRGTTATTFSPYVNISLAQVITMVVRAADAFYPDRLPTAPPDWYELWAHGDPTHGANVRRADYADLLTLIPVANTAAGLARPATRGEMSQILVNLRHRVEEPRIGVTFEGQLLELTTPVLVERNRYYLPLAELVELAGGTITGDARELTIGANGRQVEVRAEAGTYSVEGEQCAFKVAPILSEGTVRVSLVDLQQMLHLKVAWNEVNGVVHLFWKRDDIPSDRQPTGGRTALIRFEDITSGQTGRYATAESLEKLRLVFDYCYARGVPMQLGWIPRYIDPWNGIDNAPAEEYSMHNANLLYTLDYFALRRGLIGLHGYTHQFGYEISIGGSEFNSTRNTTESSIRRRVQYALDDASELQMPISFFESPHYDATDYQKAIISQYFDVMYEHRSSGKQATVLKITVGDRVVSYVPTPLHYVDGADDTNNMIAKMRALPVGDLGSFFYHPNIEFAFIALQTGEDGYPACEYRADSPLHRLVDAFIGEGFTFRGIDDL